MERLDSIDNPFGGAVWHKDRTVSTMDDAAALLDGGRGEGALVMAGHQSAGQGRFSTRRWEARPGESLLFTLVIPRALAAPGRPGAPVSLVLALGTAVWLASLDLAPRIKWPNDLLIGERKLAGILVTATRGHYLAGIGINVRQTAFASTEYRRPATSLYLEGRTAEPTGCLAPLLCALRAAFDHPDWRAACETRLWHLGQAAAIALPDGSVVEGTVNGIDHQGALLMSTAHGPRRLVSGE